MRLNIAKNLGTNGTGKNTLLRILDLFEEPTSGRFLIDGARTLNSENSNPALSTVQW
jgi:ABC-type methionine transport system ATPase subunit